MSPSYDQTVGNYFFSIRVRGRDTIISTTGEYSNPIKFELITYVKCPDDPNPIVSSVTSS